MGKPTAFCPTPADLDGITAKSLAQAATAGDPVAAEAFRICGEQLGRGLALLADILNPECIVIGSVFQRAEHLLRPAMEKALHEEALAPCTEVCRVVAAQLGDEIGDYAALAVAYSHD